MAPTEAEDSYAISAINATNFDAIVVGSGAGGSAAAYRLAMAGLRVALVERGHALPRDGSTLNVDMVVRQGAFKSKERWLDGQGQSFAPEEYFNLGGKTKWYGAALLRFSAHEFDADAAHGCSAWPIALSDLLPYYEEAERHLGVRHFDAEPDLRAMLVRLAKVSPEWVQQPLAMALGAAIASNRVEASHFDGFASVQGLKGDAQTAFLSRLAGLPNLSLITGQTVVDLLPHPQGPLRVAGVRLQDGRELLAHSTVLACGALHSPRLLQRYLGQQRLTQSLPCAPLVGRHLKLHLLTAVVALSFTRKTDLVRKTTLLLHKDLPHSSVQPLGFDGELIATLIPNFVPRWLARYLGARAYGFFLQTEDGSHHDNGVQEKAASQDLGPMLDYAAQRSPAALAEHTRLVRQFRVGMGRLGMLALSKRIGIAGTAHACGTLKAGLDPHQSVVNAEGQVHGLESLYVVDGSILPRSSRVNPSLSIYAWALRVAHRLAARRAAAAAAWATVKLQP